ncbi:MAG: hypothetical protein WC756_20725 [Taibaiella sp.]|jgi:hypothetical protein
MLFKNLLRTFFYGFLLFTRPQAILGLRPSETEQNNDISLLGEMNNYNVAVPPAFTVQDFVSHVENYKSKNLIQEQMIEDLETYYQVDYYLDENMLEKIISLYDHAHAQDNEDLLIMYYIHLKAYITLCNKNLDLPKLKKSIISQYKTLEKSMVLKSSKRGHNPIEEKFHTSWEKFKNKPQVDAAIAFNQDIDVDTLTQLLEDAKSSIFQEKYLKVIEALKYMGKHQEGRLSLEEKKLMVRALSLIKSETNYPTANIKIPTASLEDFEEFGRNNAKTVADLLKPLEGTARASETAQKLIIDNLPINHEQMLEDLKELHTYALSTNNPFLLRQASMAFYIGYQAFMEFNIHEKSNLQVFKKSTMDKISLIRAYIYDLETRAPRPIHPPFLKEFRAKISKNAAKQHPIRYVEWFTSFMKQVKSRKKLEIKEFTILLIQVETSPLRVYYDCLKDVLTAINQHYDINALSPEMIVIMRHGSFLLKREIDVTISFDRQLTEDQFEQGIKNCGAKDGDILNTALKEASEEIKTEYINYSSKKIIQIFLKNTPHDSSAALFQSINDYFNNANRPTESDPEYAIFALALEQVNITTPFTSQNLTAQSWQTIRDFESEMAKKPDKQRLYLHIKKIVIERFSTQTGNYNIPMALILLAIIIFAIKKISANSIGEIEKTTEIKHEKTKSRTSTTSSYQSAVSTDPFPDLWKEFEKFVITELNTLNENISSLLSTHHNYIQQKGKLSWINLDNSQRLLQFLNHNIDWLAHQDKSKVDAILESHNSDELRLKLKNKRSELDQKKQINDLKNMLNIKYTNKKFDKKNFDKGIKFINDSLPKEFNDSSHPSNIELVNIISRQLQFQSGLRGEEIDYILAELAKIYNDLKANKDYSNPAATVLNDNNQDDQSDSETMIPDFLYTLQIPQNIPAANTTENAPENKPVNKDKPAANYKIEIILNQPYRAFALRVKEHLNLAFNENYTQLTNRAYKLLIIQFHSLILKDKSIAYNPLLNDIRNRFCHKWDMIGHSNDLQVHLHHILLLIEQTQDGSLLSIQNLDKELSNYPQKILALEKNANPIYRGKASATEKMKTLLQEFDDTSKLSSDKEFGKLAQLALIDILCDIGETLTHCSISNVNPLWANVRTTGYHSDTPAQAIIDAAVAKGIPELKQIFKYSIPSDHERESQSSKPVSFKI